MGLFVNIKRYVALYRIFNFFKCFCVLQAIMFYLIVVGCFEDFNKDVYHVDNSSINFNNNIISCGNNGSDVLCIKVVNENLKGIGLEPDNVFAFWTSENGISLRSSIPEDKLVHILKSSGTNLHNNITKKNNSNELRNNFLVAFVFIFISSFPFVFSRYK